MFTVRFLKFSPVTIKTYQSIANKYTCNNILNTTPDDTTTCKHNNISKTKQLSLSLSPPQKSLCVLGRLGREKKKVHKGRWEGERKKRGLKDPAFSLFSLCTARFLYFNYCYVLLKYQAWATVEERRRLIQTFSVSMDSSWIRLWRKSSVRWATSHGEGLFSFRSKLHCREKR